MARTKGPAYKMKSAAHGGPMRRNFPSAFPKLDVKVGEDVFTGDEAYAKGKEAEEAESYAHSAVDTLISGIDPAALKSAFTTPLTYLTMQNLRTDPSLLTGKKGADLIETDMRTRGAPSFWDLFSQQGWTPTI